VRRLPEIAFRTTPDGRFSFAEAGRRDAPPLVFLHGIGGAARGWAKQLQFFGREWRALAWDMPGYGGSAPLADVSIASLAGALARFLDAVGAERPVLVGHSIGGMIVQQLLAEGAAAARAVVLAQTSPAFGRPDGEWQREFIAARLGPLDRGETMRDLAPRLVAELVGDDPDRDGLALARECMAAVPEASYRAMMLALMGFDLRAALPRIAVPALSLPGSKDTNAPASMMQRMAERIPGACYVCLEGVGHLAPLERPDEFNEAVSAFLASLPESSRPEPPEAAQRQDPRLRPGLGPGSALRAVRDDQEGKRTA
jgi:3-oxoadipate enol-lactonase